MAQVTCLLGPDNLGPALSRLIAKSEKRLCVAALEIGEWYGSLIAGAARRGVDVKVIIDGADDHNSDATALLAKSGASLRSCGGAPEHRMHAKFILADETLALGTGNLINRDAPASGKPGTREWWAMVDGASALFDQVDRDFLQIWRDAQVLSTPLGVMPGAEILPVHVPDVVVDPQIKTVREDEMEFLGNPERVYRAITSALESANTRVWVTVAYAHNGVPIVAKLLDRMEVLKGRGLDVRLLFGDPTPTIGGFTFAQQVMNPEHSTTGHAKGVIVDDKVIIASSNWSQAGFTSNWESGLQFRSREVAEFFSQCFARDWAWASQR